MCGIAGVIDLKDDKAINQTTSQRVANAIYQRGPEEEASITDDGVGVAAIEHRQLT